MKIGGGRSNREIQDRRGESSGARQVAVGGALPMLVLRMLFSRTGRRFLVPLLVIGGAAYFFLGPQRFMSLLAMLLGGAGGGVATGPALDPAEEARMAEFSRAVLATTDEVWTDIYAAEGTEYAAPDMVIYTGSTETGCGFGQAAMGPFYCPIADPRSGKPSVYIDLSFFKQMETRMNAGGDFAQAYVIAHEVGHHVQNLSGVLDWSQRAKQAARTKTEANQVGVRVELMADCLAGVWARRAAALPEVELEGGDLGEAIAAAQAVGDDTLQRQSTGRVVPDSFTHGSSDQRISWFKRGYQTADADACETREIAYDRL